MHIIVWDGSKLTVYWCKYSVALNPGLNGVGGNMRFHYCPLTGSMKPNLQYFHICRLRWLSKSILSEYHSFHRNWKWFCCWWLHLTEEIIMLIILSTCSSTIYHAFIPNMANTIILCSCQNPVPVYLVGIQLWFLICIKYQACKLSMLTFFLWFNLAWNKHIWFMWLKAACTVHTSSFLSGFF
jgi:hypothetical protein